MARNLSAETAMTIKIVALSKMPFTGCQKNGYETRNQRGSVKW